MVIGGNMSKIHEFDPLLYPFKLWVAKDPKISDFKDVFWGMNDKSTMIELTADNFYQLGCIASTCPMQKKETFERGCLVSLWRPKDVGVGAIAHEATHVVDWVCDEVGLRGFTFEGGEARAYLVQWVANCIEEARKAK